MTGVNVRKNDFLLVNKEAKVNQYEVCEGENLLARTYLKFSQGEVRKKHEVELVNTVK